MERWTLQLQLWWQRIKSEIKGKDVHLVSNEFNLQHQMTCNCITDQNWHRFSEWLSWLLYCCLLREESEKEMKKSRKTDTLLLSILSNSWPVSHLMVGKDNWFSTHDTHAEKDCFSVPVTDLVYCNRIHSLSSFQTATLASQLKLKGAIALQTQSGTDLAKKCDLMSEKNKNGCRIGCIYPTH